MMPSLLFNRPMLAAATPTSRQFRCAKIPLRPSVSRSQSLAPSTWATPGARLHAAQLLQCDLGSSATGLWGLFSRCSERAIVFIQDEPQLFGAPRTDLSILHPVPPAVNIWIWIWIWT